jgi:hypothetical protein
MSRRAKLLITALLLVLLAIPIGHGFYLWRLPDPLRFRVVAHHKQIESSPDDILHRLVIEVRNTRAVPVYIISGAFYEDAAGAGRGMPWGDIQRPDNPRLGELDYFIEIPAHGVWRGEVRVSTSEQALPDYGQTRILYGYASVFKVEVLHGYGRLCLHLPDSVGRRLYIEPTQYAETSLELAPEMRPTVSTPP